MLYVALAMVCVAAGVMVLANSSSSVRPPLVLLGMVVGPGWALCGFVRLPDKTLAWALALALGISINIAIGLLMIADDRWHPVGATIVLLFASAVVLLRHGLLPDGEVAPNVEEVRER